VIIYFDGRTAPIDDETPLNGLEIRLGGDERLRIFNVQFDLTTRNFSFDFNAESGAVYAVESGTDLHAFPQTTDLLTADDAVEHVVVPAIPGNVERQHYRVKLETPAP
jgi:hypothetical protein